MNAYKPTFYCKKCGHARWIVEDDAACLTVKCGNCQAEPNDFACFAIKDNIAKLDYA